jgi:hypothetical protein
MGKSTLNENVTVGEISIIIATVLWRSFPSVILFTTNSTCSNLGPNLGHNVEKPATTGINFGIMRVSYKVSRLIHYH